MAPAPRSGCAINAAVEVLGDPWAILVLRDIIFGNRRYFRELLVGSEEGIQVLPVMVALGNWGLGPPRRRALLAGPRRASPRRWPRSGGGNDGRTARAPPRCATSRRRRPAVKRTITRRLRGSDQRRRQRALRRHPTLTLFQARPWRMEALHP